MTALTASSGSSAVTSGYDGYGNLSSTLSNVGGNKLLNGNSPIHMVGLAGSLAGHGASSTVSLAYGGTSTSNFTAAAGSAAASTGYKAFSRYCTGAGSGTFSYNFTGSIYFGRSSTSGSNGVSDGNGSGFTGTLGMSYQYYEGPTAPLSPTVMRATTTSATVGWSAPSSNGGTALTGYAIQASPVADFSSGVITTTVAGTVTSATVTGLTSNASYYFRLTATNEVSDHYSTSSIYSTVVNMPQVILFPKTWNGSAWVRASDWLVWNGTQWAVPQAVLVWNGTAWVSAA